MKLRIHRTWLIAGGSIVVIGAVLGSYSIWAHANAARSELNQTLIPETIDNSETLNNTIVDKKVVKPKPTANQPENSNSVMDDEANEDPLDNNIADEPNNNTDDNNSGGGSSSGDNQAPWEQGPSDQ